MLLKKSTLLNHSEFYFYYSLEYNSIEFLMTKLTGKYLLLSFSFSVIFYHLTSDHFYKHVAVIEECTPKTKAV